MSGDELEDMYDVIADLRQGEQGEDRLEFPRNIRGAHLDVQEDSDSIWFCPVKMSWEHFNSLTDREVVRYIYSQELDRQ